VVALLCWAVLKPDGWLGLFFFSALLLPPLPIALGDSGPHIAILFAAAGLFGGLLRLQDWRIQLDLQGSALLIFLAVLLASVAMAAVYSGLGIAAGSLARVFLFGISVYVFFYTAHGPGARAGWRGFTAARLLFCAAAGSALFACIDFYFQFPAPAGYGRQFVWLASGTFRRAQGVFYEAGTLGNLCAFFLLMTLVAVFRKRATRLLPPAALFAGSAVFLVALVLSYSRSSLLNLAAALIAFLWIERRRVGIVRLLVLAASCVAAGAAGAILLFPVFAEAWWSRIAFSAQFFSESPGAILSGRLDSWSVLTTFLMEHPWHTLIGIGYKTLPYSEFIGRTVIGDNMYLTMLVETGVIGLAALCFLNFAILRSAWRAARSGDSSRSFFGVWIFCFWCGQLFQMLSADVLTYWRLLPMYMWVLAMAVRESRADDHPVSRSI
jgi:O-antigen ligase